MKKPIAINFYGGPGTGKSTMAAAVFSELKNFGVNCELVTEYAKKKVWEEAFKVFECQMYVCANQIYNMFIVSKHVDAIITDSPLIMATVYNNKDKPLNEILLREYKKYENIDIFLRRVKEYNPKGRTQNEKEAKQKDKEIKSLLNKYGVNYIEYDGTRDSVSLIVKRINDRLAGCKWDKPKEKK